MAEKRTLLRKLAEGFANKTPSGKAVGRASQKINSVAARLADAKDDVKTLRKNKTALKKRGR